MPTLLPQLASWLQFAPIPVQAGIKAVGFAVVLQANIAWLQWLLGALSAAIIVMLVVLIFNLRLQRKVEQRTRELAVSEERYRTLFENAVEGVFETTIEGRFRAVNPALARMLGFEGPQEMIAAYEHVGRDLYADPKRRDEFIRALDAHDRIVNFESEVRCRDGSTRWVSENVRAVRDAHRRLLYFQGFVSDVNERRRASDALRASEERYRVLFEQSPVAIIELDYRKIGAWLDRLRAQGASDLKAYLDSHPQETEAEKRNLQVAAMNEETVRLLRAPSKKHAVENFLDVLVSDGWKTWQETLQAIWAGHYELEGEAILTAFDGSVLRTYFRWWLPRVNGRPVYEWTQIILVDLTQRIRLDQEIQRASRLESIGLLAGGIAHDFNNILTVVMGHLALVAAESSSHPSKWLKEAESGVMRARDLTQQLLTFSKGGEPVRAAVLLPDVVQEAAQFALHGSRAICEFRAEDDLWPANVDKAQIGQVVQNLVINAVQAMPDGGTIKISLRNENVTAAFTRGHLSAGNYLKTSIADTGCGIPSDLLPRIFEPYFTTKKTGSGLGLATVYSIIRKHKGHIEVESEPGRGTTFHFWLPAAQERPAEPAEPGPALSPMTGRVLFMDDEEPLREMAQTLLARLGFEATVVSEGAEAVHAYQAAQAEGRPYQVVVLDLTVPGGMSGSDTLAELRKLDPRVRAVVSSGYSGNPELADYRSHGFIGRLAKPYRLTDLAKVMRAALEGVEME